VPKIIKDIYFRMRLFFGLIKCAVTSPIVWIKMLHLYRVRNDVLIQNIHSETFKVNVFSLFSVCVSVLVDRKVMSLLH